MKNRRYIVAFLVLFAIILTPLILSAETFRDVVEFWSKVKFHGTKVEVDAGTELDVDGTLRLDGNLTTNVVLADGTSAIKSGQLTGTTLVGIEIVPQAVATGYSLERLIRFGDITVGDYFGFNSTTSRAVGVTANFGRKIAATSAFTGGTPDKTAEIYYNNAATNNMQAYEGMAVHIKAKNAASGTMKNLYGLDVEVMRDGTVSNEAVALRVRDSGGTDSDYLIQAKNKTGTVELSLTPAGVLTAPRVISSTSFGTTVGATNVIVDTSGAGKTNTIVTVGGTILSWTTNP